MTPEKFKQTYRVESSRLKDWDYSEGAYFVTICTRERINHFGGVKNGIIELSEIGGVVKQYWAEMPAHFPFVELDEYIVMPNHIHGVLFLNSENQDVMTGCRDAINRVSTTYGGITGKHNPMNKNSLPKIIRWYKGRTTFEIHKLHGSGFHWQSRFYDHIIRDDIALTRIREYITNNALTWGTDSENLTRYSLCA